MQRLILNKCIDWCDFYSKENFLLKNCLKCLCLILIVKVIQLVLALIGMQFREFNRFLISNGISFLISLVFFLFFFSTELRFWLKSNNLCCDLILFESVPYVRNFHVVSSSIFFYGHGSNMSSKPHRKKKSIKNDLNDRIRKMLQLVFQSLGIFIFFLFWMNSSLNVFFLLFCCCCCCGCVDIWGKLIYGTSLDTFIHLIHMSDSSDESSSLAIILACHMRPDGMKVSKLC